MASLAAALAVRSPAGSILWRREKMRSVHNRLRDEIASADAAECADNLCRRCKRQKAKREYLQCGEEHRG